MDIKRFFFRVRLLVPHCLRSALYLFLSLALGADECAVCGKPARALPVCRSCLKTLLSAHKEREDRCEKCGRRLISETGLCMKCRDKSDDEPPGGPHVSFCFPVFPYMLWMKELASAWKTRGVRLLSPVFAGILADVFDTRMAIGEAVVVPVPPRPGKLRKKGWDQVEELCRWLEIAHNVPVLRLLRRRSAVEQKKLDRQEREKNAREAYFFDGDARKKIDSGKIALPEKVVLLDDVRTTGATLEICAAALKDAGVKEVRAAVLFGVD
jgi:predicted amidophosphoribosyltransferase